MSNCSNHFIRVGQDGSKNATDMIVFGYLLPPLCSLGMICNGLSIWVLLGRDFRRNAPYTYLTFLSFSDFLNNLLMLWHFLVDAHVSHRVFAYCAAALSPLIVIFMGWSILITAALTIDRYVHIHRKHDNESERLNSHNRAHYVSIGLLLIAACAHLPRGMSVFYNEDDGCLTHRDWAKQKDGWFYYYSIIRFIAFKIGNKTVRLFKIFFTFLPVQFFC